MKSFSAFDAIKFGWGVAKKKWQLFLAFICLQIVLSAIPEIPSWFLGEESAEADLYSLVLTIPTTVVNFIVSLGMVKILLKLVDGKDAMFSEVWYVNWKLILYLMLSGALSTLIIFGGFILLIIPGIIFALKLMFVQYYIVDRGMGPVEAIKASWNATRGNLMELLLLGVLNFVVVLVGALALVVGLILAVPTTMVAMAYVYRKLSK